MLHCGIHNFLQDPVTLSSAIFICPDIVFMLVQPHLHGQLHVKYEIDFPNKLDAEQQLKIKEILEG